MALVSVVVPVYKTECYLKRCVESIRKQTLQDIEIILVNDGSPDSCPQICDEYVKIDDRIKVIHKQNGGLSSARNAGINLATGQYIGFVDSDDYIELDMFEKLYLCAEQNQVDFVMADYWRIRGAEKNKKTLDIRDGLYEKKDIINEIYPMLIMRECVDYGPLLSVWHCLYLTDFIKKNNLFFDEDIKWSEDCIYSAILGYKTNRFYYLKGECLYNYVQNNGSITTSFKPQAWDVYCKMNEKLRTFFECREDFDFSRQLDLHMLYFSCSFLGQLKYSQHNFWGKYKIRKKVLNDICFKRAMNGCRLPNVDVKNKVFFAFMKYRCAMILTLIS